jgi:predicted TIM-barrel fold metal-dependent hydrolase
VYSLISCRPRQFTKYDETMPERLPRNTCDSHLHIFGDARIYPVSNPHALYQPPEDCTFTAMQAMHDALGVDRAVFVQPTIYGTDHRLMHDVLKSAPPQSYRGVAIIDDSVSDTELARLDSVGVRGARFNFGGNFRLAPSVDGFRRGLARVRELGWFVKIFGFGDDFLVVEPELRKIDVPAIIDHMGGPDYRRGTAQPAIRLILDLLAKGNWWIGLSNGDLRSQSGYPWDDAVEFGRLFYNVAPDRCMWGTDWPHVHRFIRPDHEHSDYGIDHELRRVALLERYVPDRQARDQVLIGNPARFFGF